jgi:UDP-glucose 4-epimerase
MRRVFITGGSGYIGSVVVKRLIQCGYDVAVFDNLERGHRCNVDSDAELIVGDLRNKDAIADAMQFVKPDAVLHFAAYALVGESMANPMMYFDNNVKGGVNLLAAMEAVGCKRIVFSSSCATYGVPPGLPIEEEMPQNPTNPYGHSKLMFEQMCIWLQNTRGLKPTFLRYFNAAGAAWGMVEDHSPETHIIPNVLKVALGQKEYVQIFGDDYPTPDGTCVRDYVHVEDLTSAHILALEKEVLGAFNLGTGRGISVKEIVDACRLVTGHPIPVKRCPRRQGDPPALYASGNKARKIMGWNPMYSDIETIVRDAWSAHQKFPAGYEENALD